MSLVALRKPLSSGAGGVYRRLHNRSSEPLGPVGDTMHILLCYIKPPAGAGAAPESSISIFLQQGLSKESQNRNKGYKESHDSSGHAVLLIRFESGWGLPPIELGRNVQFLDVCGFGDAVKSLWFCTASWNPIGWN